MTETTTETRTCSRDALLVHAAVWELPERSITLEPGLSLNRFEGTHVERLYHRLYPDNGIDLGDPFLYEVFILREPPASDWLDPWDSTSMVQRAATLLAILTANTPGMCRLIRSTDGFRSCNYNDQVAVYGPQTDFISARTEVTEDTAKEIVTAWCVLRAVGNESGHQRLTNALVYFYDACRAPTLEPVGVNLSLALEMLLGFAPNDDAGDQIAVAVSRLLHGEADGQRDIEVVRQLYDFRSRLFSRGTIEYYEDTVVDAFAVVAGTFRKVLLDGKIARAVLQ